MNLPFPCGQIIKVLTVSFTVGSVEQQALWVVYTTQLAATNICSGAADKTLFALSVCHFGSVRRSVYFLLAGITGADVFYGLRWLPQHTIVRDGGLPCDEVLGKLLKAAVPSSWHNWPHTPFAYSANKLHLGIEKCLFQIGRMRLSVDGRNRYIKSRAEWLW